MRLGIVNTAIAVAIIIIIIMVLQENNHLDDFANAVFCLAGSATAEWLPMHGNVEAACYGMQGNCGESFYYS